MSKRKGKKPRPRRGERGARRTAGSRNNIEDTLLGWIVWLFESVADASVPAEEIAPALLELHEDEAPPAGFLESIARRGSPERAREVAADVASLGPGSACAASLQAAVAAMGGDHAGAERILVAATRRHREDRCLAAALAAARLELGRAADALEQLERLCREDPGDDETQALYAKALRTAALRLGDVSPAGQGVGAKEPCPCGSGKRYGGCCRPREEEAVARFEDRSAFVELRRALEDFWERPEFDEMRAMAWEEWFEDDEGPGPEDAGLVAMMMERAFLVLPTSEETEEDDDEPDSMLELFAHDPATSRDMNRRAHDWAGFGCYGLWQVTDSEPSPGIHLVDILTGSRIYAALSDAVLQHVSRWTVLLAMLLPVDGVWRVGAGTILLSPQEGDALAETIFELARRYVKELPKAARPPARELALPGPAGRIPVAALAERAPRRDPRTGELLDNVVGASLPMLVDVVEAGRARPVDVRNTDGEPLLFIKASIEVERPEELRRRLEKHPDIRPLEGARLLWEGREMTRGEYQTAAAEARARFGKDLVEEKASHRYTRAELEFDGSVVKTEVNSKGRLERLVALLEEAGGRPRVVSETRFDPDQDLPAPNEVRRPSGPSGRSKESVEAWQQAWLDERVPALGGWTPREAARDERRRPYLEALLRQFEFAGDRSRARGDPAPDTDWMRSELDM